MLIQDDLFHGFIVKNAWCIMATQFEPLRVPKHVTKVEINVFTEDNVKQDPVIDLTSSTETLGKKYFAVHVTDLIICPKTNQWITSSQKSFKFLQWRMKPLNLL